MDVLLGIAHEESVLLSVDVLSPMNADLRKGFHFADEHLLSCWLAWVRRIMFCPCREVTHPDYSSRKFEAICHFLSEKDRIQPLVLPAFWWAVAEETVVEIESVNVDADSHMLSP